MFYFWMYVLASLLYGTLHVYSRWEMVQECIEMITKRPVQEGKHKNSIFVGAVIGVGAMWPYLVLLIVRKYVSIVRWKIVGWRRGRRWKRIPLRIQLVARATRHAALCDMMDDLMLGKRHA